MITVKRGKLVYLSLKSNIRGPGAMTLSITTFTITTFSIMPFSMMIIKCDNQHNDTQRNDAQHKGRALLYPVPTMLWVTYDECNI